MKFEKYSKTFLHFYTTEIPELLAHFFKKEKFSLVDMGAGDGALLVALQLKGHLAGAKEVVAVDLSEERCKRLREHTNFNVICSDVTQVSMLVNQSFDYVVCTQVIEHVKEDKLLAEIKRVIKPGGYVYIASVVKKWYGWWYYRTAEGKWGLDPTHLREYSSKEAYESIIRAAGLNIIKTQLTPLKLSVIEFLVRRVFCSLFKVETINALFLKSKFADFLRRKINIHPPGYYIIETVATKP
jgi:2-polyprenyl-3-methyl-5-hydroxy-6-metoxy-1,4-benzoquinol methylase